MKAILKALLIMFLIFNGIQKINGQNIDKDLKRIFDNIRNNEIEKVDVKNIYDTIHALEASNLITQYTFDSLVKIRLEAYRMKNIIGNKSGNIFVKRSTINALLKGCNDKDPTIVNFCSIALRNYKKEEYNSGAKKELGKLLLPKQKSLENIVLLAGFIGEKEYEELLKTILLEPSVSKIKSWNTNVALARMGNEQSLQFVINKIKSQPVNDDVMLELAPYLVYIRQKQSLDYLFEIILSEEKNCTSAEPDSDEPIFCGYRAVELVAPVVNNFPVKVDVSGDLDVSDYEKALTTSREWITKNRDKYTVIDNTY